MYKNPSDFRKQVIEGKYREHTSGIVGGFAQGNLVILPKIYAYEFLVFAYRNPKACPILGISEVGSKQVGKCCGEDNIYKLVPEYYVYEDGILAKTCHDVDDLYQEDFVVFVIGCSFTFESELISRGIKLKHIQEGKNVAMFNTNIQLASSGPFEGTMVVSMRPIKKNLVDEVVNITSRFPMVHGGPIHIGDPNEIGIKNIAQVDYGDPVTIDEDEVAVFWACGVTPQNALKNAKLPLAITHSPGKMIVTDIKNQDLKLNF